MLLILTKTTYWRYLNREANLKFLIDEINTRAVTVLKIVVLKCSNNYVKMVDQVGKVNTSML